MKAFLISMMILSQGPWTLKECIEYALDHNIKVQQSSITVQQKEVTLNTAENRMVPNLNAGVSQNFSFGRGLTADNTYTNANTTNTGLNLQTNMPVFSGLDITNSIRMGKLDLAAAISDLAKAKDDVRVAVAKAYVQILYNHKILEVANAQVALDSMLLARRTAMRDNGKASAADVASQQATLAKSRLTRTQSHNNLMISILELTQLLELTSPEGFDVVNPSESALGLQLLANPDDIYQEAITFKPQIVADSIRIDYARVNVRKAKGAYLPTLALNGGIGSNYYTSSVTPQASFANQIQNNFSQYIGLSLNIPIFSRFSTRNSVRSAELTLNNQMLSAQQNRRTLYKEIQQAYYNALASQSKYVSSEEAANSALASFELILQKYENGKANVTEYNESKNRYLEAASNHLQAQYECLFLTRMLDFYRDGTLDF